MNITKRDGRKVDFDKNKVKVAIMKAFIDIDNEETTYAKEKTREISNYIESLNRDMTVEEVQDVIVNKLMASSRKDVAAKYVEYRFKRKIVRDSNTTDREIFELLGGENEYWATENSNKNPDEVTVQRDYIAGITSTDITRRFLLPDDIRKAHDEGIIHFHDADYFAQHSLHNCDLINLEDMLQNGTIINGVMIEKPHRLLTAITIATQIITAVASSQYGGCTITLTHLAPFVRDSYEYYINKYRNRGFGDESINFAKEDLVKEITDAVQTFNYQINSMSTTNGQAPFLSVFMYLNEDKRYTKEVAMLIEEILRQRIIGMKNEKGIYVTQAFPKLLYTLEEQNIHEDSEYWYLTKLAVECSAKRMVPDYISEKKMIELKGACYSCMGCRSFLTPDRTQDNISKCNNYTKGHKYYGRFNQGVVTINLPDIALSSEKNMDKFWDIFDERMELCHKALQIRHKRLTGVKSNVAPILWQNGALARLNKDETIDNLLYDGYSTISLGYAGLYECVKYMTGHSHTDNGFGKEFALKVMHKINDKCNEWKTAENIDYSPYGSPIESTTYKFAKCLKERFGIIEGITDRNYITNSYHVPVFEKIDAFTKLQLESEFQELSGGGAISYIEISNINHNLDALESVIKFMYENIMYAEINTKSDYCQICGYNGEIKIVPSEGNGQLIWECPQCKNRDTNKMNVTRRTCGYIGTNYWNQGRTQEINERVLHL